MKIKADLVETLGIEASNAQPNECCGILFGENETITHIQPTQNVHPAPATHFEIEPAALIAAHKAEREGGPKIVGYYHSHPKGPPEPSRTDQASAAGDGKIWAIIGRGEIRFWLDQPDGFKPLSYSVTDP
ncbi:Mov34/MPN/PAD-1 family protein [Pontixanthobacter aquaemixtae]|nr:M67 family metallopeptidase [Pontixanthobacter aquaemixtae]